jgi:hypothetical protein
MVPTPIDTLSERDAGVASGCNDTVVCAYRLS